MSSSIRATDESSLYVHHTPCRRRRPNPTLRATLAARYADQHALVSVEMHDRARYTRLVAQDEGRKLTPILPSQCPLSRKQVVPLTTQPVSKPLVYFLMSSPRPAAWPYTTFTGEHFKLDSSAPSSPSS